MERSTGAGSRERRRQIVGAVLGILIFAIGYTMIDVWTALGTRAEGSRLERIERSAQFEEGRFTNRMPMYQSTDLASIAAKFFFGSRETRQPKDPIEVLARSADDFTDLPDDLRITWFGHSSFLVELDGRRILVDPVWGERASPSSFFGPKRFYDPVISIDDLPEIDAVVISHDHYDHLNQETIKALHDRVPLFIAPLGVGAHLEYWGVDASKIVETDWWESVEVGEVRLVCTPARHFSGRGFGDRDATLWSGWAFLGVERRVFYSGDSGYSHGFKEIGERLGPFDITLIESGAYNQDWPDVHFGPEQAVQAHLDVKGDVFMPVHWGMFDLAFHGWTEPIERILVAAEKAEVSVVSPRPGMSVGLPPQEEVDRWWPDVEWLTGEESPVVSTGL